MDPTLLDIALTDTTEAGQLMAADLLEDLDREMEAVVLRLSRALTEKWRDLGETQHYWVRVVRDHQPCLLLISKRTNGTRYLLRVGDRWRRFDWSRGRGCTLRPANPPEDVVRKVRQILDNA